MTARISHTSEPKARLAPTSHLNPIAATQMSMQSSTAPRKRSPFSVCSRHAVAQEPGAKLFWMFRPEHAQMVFFAEEDHIPGSVEARELEELYVWEPPRRSVPLCIACTTYHKRVAAFEYEPRGRAFYCEHHCPRTGTPVDVYERLRCRDCAARGALQLALFVCPLCRCMLCEACAAAHDPAHACIDARTVETAQARAVVRSIDARVRRAKETLDHRTGPGYAVANHLVEILRRARAKLDAYERSYPGTAGCDMVLWLLCLQHVACLLDAAVDHPPDRELLAMTVQFLSARVRTSDGLPVPGHRDASSSSSPAPKAS